MNDRDIAALDQVQFLDHHAITWRDVRRTRCLFYQRFHYQYPGPIQNLEQRLVVIPSDRYGSQHLRDHVLTVNPLPASTQQSADMFGNRVLEFSLPEADDVVVFEVLMMVESEAHAPYRPAITRAERDTLLKPTRLTMPDAAILAAARRLQSESGSPHDLAQRINNWVYGVMRYKSGVTTVATTAAEALALGEGLCQDYSHLMIALCRAAKLPARYVSGHLLGEGGSHAWVEVFLPTEYGLGAFAFDPTNDRHPHLDYITVAVGRDYRDVSPTSGSFTAPYGGRLTCSKRAGLTMVEYFSGEIVRSAAVQ